MKWEVANTLDVILPKFVKLLEKDYWGGIYINEYEIVNVYEKKQLGNEEHKYVKLILI